MIVKTITTMRFEKQDLKLFNEWKKEHHYSLRKIGKEIGISSTYIDDMVKGRMVLNERFKNWLFEKEILK